MISVLPLFSMIAFKIAMLHSSHAQAFVFISIKDILKASTVFYIYITAVFIRKKCS